MIVNPVTNRLVQKKGYLQRLNHGERIKKYIKKYRLENKEKIKRQQQSYYQTPHARELRRLNDKCYREKHKEEKKIKDKIYYEKNKTRINAQHRDYWHRKYKERAKIVSKRYRETHEEKIKKYKQQWNLENKEKLGLKTRQYRKSIRGKLLRLASKLRRRSFGEIEITVIIKVISRDKKRCQYCGILCKEKNDFYNPEALTLDHKIPLSRLNEFSVEEPHSKNNLVVSCRRCNSKKGSMTVEEFLQYPKNRKINEYSPCRIFPFSL